MRINPEHADFVFLGAGASATLLLMRMEKHGLLTHKKIIIFDPDEKNKNDKTYCFWSSEQEEPAKSCAHLISHQWNNIRVNQITDDLNLSSKKYFHISSIDLYEEQKRIIGQHQIQRIARPVEQLESVNEGVKINCINGSWISKMVFDSRTPSFMPPAKDDAHLLQSFLGYVIKTEMTSAPVDSADLMDFDVQQVDATQFMYVLPFNNQEMLVELTRFGSTIIDEEKAQPILDQYILRRFGFYKIVGVERGCIPMTTLKFQTDNLPDIVNIGARGGALKSSTGYAFKNMFFHAESICQSIRKQEMPVQPSRPSRFRLYDRLLLLILLRQPSCGKTIFESLFRKNAINNILDFLDEKTSLPQEMKLFSTLPFGPFLQALGKVMLVRCIKFIQPMLMLLIALLLLFLQQHCSNPMFEKTQWVLFSIGLLAVGIPHGAIDHLVESNNINKKITLSFVIQYTGMAFLYFGVWILAPLTALIFFILFSAWHFGQTDSIEWQNSGSRIMDNMFWGFIVLAGIILGHLSETNAILERMEINSLHLSNQKGNYIVMLLLALAVCRSLWQRNLTMFLNIITIYISTFLPLVSAFGLYFIGQHSITVWSHLKKSMSVNNRSLYLKALPFTLGALLLFLLLLLFYQNGVLQNFETRWLSIFFIFISCISFPHVVAMSNFYIQVFRKK